jgi:Cell wall-active antibiotics response LiaF, C-terminal
VPLTRFERVVTVLGDERRVGRWEVPPRLDVTCLLGEVTLDFTEAIVRQREVVVHVGAILGSVKIIVPDGIDVRMDLTASILGEGRQLTGPVTPGGPVYWIRGIVVLGDVTVRPARKRRSLFGR